MNIDIVELSAVNKNKTICLNMIVKDESKVIIETLKNLLENIEFDYWVISDTGSTDNTQQLIKDFFYDKSIPGEIFNDEWRDFGYNRTRALEHAYGKTDYLFIFDADDRIEGKFILPFPKKNSNNQNQNQNHNQLFLDGYMLKIGKGFEYVRPLLINNNKKWEFKGVLHEYLTNVEPVGNYGKIEGDYHIVSGRSGNRSTNPTKYYDDAILLEKAYEKELLLPHQGLSGRYAFYCARSYKDAGKQYWDKSIEWYKKLLARETHWNQERYYAALEIGIMYKDKDQTQMEDAIKYLLKTVEIDSERIEGVVIAVEYFYHSNQFLLINALYHKFKNYNNNNPDLNDKLFINKHFYNDRIEFFNAITAYNVNDALSGYECCKRVLINNKSGSNEINVVINNLYHIKQYKELLENDNEQNLVILFRAIDTILYCNNDIINNVNINGLWNLLFNKIKTTFVKFNTTVNFNASIKMNTLLQKKAKGPTEDKMQEHHLPKKEKIIITFTTCKRFDLFTQTVNSILNTWNDLDKIDYWFCVDDNSSIKEREVMEKYYNWIEYYMKTPEEKGHRSSMNIIWNKLQTLKPTYWIHMEDDFLFYYSTNYITKGINVLKYNNNNIHQVVFNKNYAETIDYYKSKGHLPIEHMSDIVLHNHLPNKGKTDYPNSHYWPHYSFRPSITRVDTILQLGNYDSSNQFFERDYADKWNAAGFKTAFFDRITHLHIGRLTSEIGDNTKRNAYDLNNESQFTTIQPGMNLTLDSNVKIVNLERREDRKKNTINALNDACITDFTFFKAIDGKELISTNELKLMFNGNDFGNRKGVIGCAMSHLKLWRDLIEDKQYNYYIIFEDDLTIPDSKNFKTRIDKLKENGEFDKNEMLFLGYHMFENKRKQVRHIYDLPDEILLTSKVEQLNQDLYIGGTFAYSINKIGAQKMIDYIKKNGIKHGIDYVMKIAPDINKYELQPLIVMSDWNEDASKQVDTDIQTNYDSLDFSHTLEDNFDFIPCKDQIGNDMYFKPPAASASASAAPPVEEMKIALKDNKCAGFNTLGFFKNKIELAELQQSMYFKPNDGLYVKKSYIKSHKTRRIKMLCNWCSSEQLCKEWSTMCHDKLHKKWKNIEITCEDKEIDYYVIINSPPVDAVYEPSKTIVFQMEPWVYDETKQWGVKTWGNEWSSPDPTKFLRVFTHKTHLNNVQWQIDYPFHSTPVPEGSKKLNRVAAICSEKNFDNGHLLRNNFIRYMGFGETNRVVDIFGRENYHQFSNYKGPVPADNKYNVYANYKYCLGVENNSEDNYATEKLWEAILCESLCFYWGCPNLEEYIDEKAFVRLPLEDPIAALQLIQQAIAEDWWSQRIEIIKQMKEKILNELGFFPLMNKIIMT